MWYASLSQQVLTVDVSPQQSMLRLALKPDEAANILKKLELILIFGEF
ncbi:hypothetical protein SOASR030_17700 [Leminorella grimontii]|uniref:Uncharacterized protein n=1 Tax=Leminorella grimontii TaxID=82981 RepID=A0AAV5N415_9GAMM|nr:hypothetical protein GLGR_3208 [Leminorella grimontii ATCC 33999 = DSM 5078]GKX55658.1 hypothetical protein SOASR030_17700 [Leminorella grimontii]GKX59468.1 hypothetical protein SOASR031_17830 [Leminorella grimontii]VFS55420.1 Uncharacterised protein [Leminorella grimontii]